MKSRRAATGIICLLIGIACGYAVGNLLCPCYSVDKIAEVYPTETELDKLLDGDTLLYLAVMERCRKVPNYHNLMDISYVMANMYDFTPANYDIYKTIVDTYAAFSCDMDERTKDFALFYLKRGAEKGDIRAQRELKKLSQ